MTGADSQTAADAAERCPACAATAPYWRPDDRECEICVAITEVPGALDELTSDVEDGYGAAVIGEHVKHLRQKHALLVEHVGKLLADRARMAAELKQVRVDRRRLGDAYASGWHDAIAAVRMPSTLQREEAWATYRVAREDAWGAETTATRPADGPDGAVWSAGLGNALPGAQRGAEGDGEAED